MNTDELIKRALEEDLPQGDITTDSISKGEEHGVAFLIAKQDLVLSGTELFEKTVAAVDSQLKIQWKFKETEPIYNKQVVATIQGNLVNLLKAERVALNFLGYLSGIATSTNQFVQACQGTETKILDTRKTIPLYREWSKKAVRDGGGINHRMNLSDAVLVKENHLHIGGTITETVTTIREKTDLPIEVEVKNLEEVREAAALDIQRIMLDNMSLEDMKVAIQLIPESIDVEASGNMTLEKVREVAPIGLDYVSIGALTHSVKNADFSLLFNWS